MQGPDPAPDAVDHQATKPKKTVLALLDYSNVFDRVWREDLLIRAIDKGLPITVNIA